MGNPDALIILSTTSNFHMKPAEAVNKAYEVKSLEAAKILNTTHIFAPSRQRSAQNYVETLKTLSNFYVRSSNSKEKR